MLRMAVTIKDIAKDAGVAHSAH